MFDIALRHLKDDLFDPLSRHVPRFITPLQITAAAFLCGLQACLCALRGNIPLSIVFWFLNRALDCLDGAVARHRADQSELGGFLDVLADFIVYSLIPICCALGKNTTTTTTTDTTGNPPGANPGDPGTGAGAEADMLVVALLEASFHVNNTVLFYVAAVVEKAKAKAKATPSQGDEEQKAEELTSLALRPALVEGLESAVLFTLMLLFPSYLRSLSCLMLAGVACGTVQRVAWVVSALRRPVKKTA